MAISRDYMEGFRDKRAISREISCIHNHASIGKLNCKKLRAVSLGLGVMVNINCLIMHTVSKGLIMTIRAHCQVVSCELSVSDSQWFCRLHLVAVNLLTHRL